MERFNERMQPPLALPNRSRGHVRAIPSRFMYPRCIVCIARCQGSYRRNACLPLLMRCAWLAAMCLRCSRRRRNASPRPCALTCHPPLLDVLHHPLLRCGISDQDIAADGGHVARILVGDAQPGEEVALRGGGTTQVAACWHSAQQAHVQRRRGAAGLWRLPAAPACRPVFCTTPPAQPNMMPTTLTQIPIGSPPPIPTRTCAPAPSPQTTQCHVPPSPSVWVSH